MDTAAVRSQDAPLTVNEQVWVPKALGGGGSPKVGHSIVQRSNVLWEM